MALVEALATVIATSTEADRVVGDVTVTATVIVIEIATEAEDQGTARSHVADSAEAVIETVTATEAKAGGVGTASSL